MKYVVWVLVIFSGYTVYSFSSYWSTSSSVERAVETALGEVSSATDSDGIRKRIAKRVGLSEIELSDVEIAREGQIVHVAVHFPISVSYFGSRTFDGEVEMTRTLRFDHAAEERRRWKEKKDQQFAVAMEALEECEDMHGGPGSCALSRPGVWNGEIEKDY